MATISNQIRWASNVEELKKNILEGIGTIDAMKASVDRTAAAMGGQGLFLQANKLTAAVQQLGGSAKLTTAEKVRLSASLDKAIEKYRVMGQTAPAAMIKLADETRRATSSGESWSLWLGKANTLLGLFGAGLSVTAIVGFARSLLNTADQLDKLSPEALERIRKLVLRC
mgnify:CR=1 FL=1